MNRRFDKVLLAIAFAVCLGALARPAQAQSKDEEANQIADEALLGDYLALNFDAAID